MARFAPTGVGEGVVYSGTKVVADLKQKSGRGWEAKCRACTYATHAAKRSVQLEDVLRHVEAAHGEEESR